MSKSGSHIPQFDHTPRSIAQDDRLSPEALGVLIFMRSLPGKWKGSLKDWRFIPDVLRERFGWGRDKFQRVMRELRECEYITLEKGGPGGGSAYLLNELVEDAVIREVYSSNRSRAPDREPDNPAPASGSENRKSPTSGKSDYRKSRLSYKEKNTSNREEDMLKNKERHGDGVRDLSFLKQESDLFYQAEIERVLDEIGDPCLIWTNQTGKSGLGAAPFSTIAGLVSEYGLEIYAAGVVIGANDSSRPRISIRFCAAIMKRLHTQRESERHSLDLKEEDVDRLGSQFGEL